MEDKTSARYKRLKKFKAQLVRDCDNAPDYVQKRILANIDVGLEELEEQMKDRLKLRVEEVKVTKLPARMTARADAYGLGGDHPMRIAANELAQACTLYYKEEPELTVFKFSECFARARSVWVEHTGEGITEQVAK